MSGHLRVAIVHYHLRSGGVTKVIQHAATALEEADVNAVVLAGEPPQEPLPVAYRTVPGLRYDKPAGTPRVEALVDALCREAQAALGGPPDLWHFHNHSLGKNLALPAAVSCLAKRGEHLLLQIHDFPEDGRPALYRRLVDELGQGRIQSLSETLYPAGAHVHYAVLNGRDFSFMKEAGVLEECLHFLPNCADMPVDFASVSSDPVSNPEGPVVYPTRGIRRKNLGEFLLWAAASDGNNRFLTTLAPKNPKARPVYEAWVRLARSLDLPVDFGVADKSHQSFIEILRSANTVISTSIAEGFGLAFLEPWLLGRSLSGRNLPSITADFESVGLNLDHLYDRLDMPLGWIGRERLFHRIQTIQSKYHHDYGQEVPPDAAARALDDMVRNDRVDFGRLDEPFQEEVIRRICESDSDRRELRPVSPFHPEASSSDLIEHNRQAVLREFSLSHYGARLRSVYEKVMESAGDLSQDLSSEALLNKFLLPERFSLLRTN